MSRTLDATQSALVESSDLRVIPLVTLTTYTDREAETGAVTRYISDRPVRYDFGNTSTVREFLPWLEGHPDGINVVSCASAENDDVRTKTREFCKLNDFSFPTLVDENSQIGDLYKVTTTPTIVIIGPDGVVDSAIAGRVDRTGW